MPAIVIVPIVFVVLIMLGGVAAGLMEWRER